MRRVQHTVCFAPPRPSPYSSLFEQQDEDVPCSVTSSIASDGHAIVRVAPYDGAHPFRFHRVLAAHDRGAAPLDVLSACPVSTTAPHTVFLVHGPEDVDTYAVFRGLIADIISTVHAPDEAAHVEYSILRIYSWGATDVLRCEAVEDNMSTPRKTPFVTGTTEITPARRGRASLNSAADLRPLWDALERAKLVPEWHSALCCSLYAPVSQGGFGTVKLLLLPRLLRANHLLRRDVLQLRSWLGELDGSHSRAVVNCRLKDFLVDAPRGSDDGDAGDTVAEQPPCMHIHVLTVLRKETKKLEETALNAWFGSCSSGESDQSRAYFTALLATHKETSSPSPLAHGTARHSAQPRPVLAVLEETVVTVTPTTTTTPPRRRSLAAQLNATPLSPQPPLVTVSSPGSQESREDLVRQLSAAQREVGELTLVKHNLERVVAELTVQLSDMLTEVDDSMAEMLSEVDRAEQALRVYQSTTATEQRTEMRRIERRLSSIQRAPSP